MRKIIKKNAIIEKCENNKNARIKKCGNGVIEKMRTKNEIDIIKNKLGSSNRESNEVPKRYERDKWCSKYQYGSCACIVLGNGFLWLFEIWGGHRS